MDRKTVQNVLDWYKNSHTKEIHDTDKEKMINTTINFPDTIEEYMEEYKIVDSEQIYTNGVELIPIFRIKQWLEAHPNTVEIVRCYDCIYHTEDNECANGRWDNWSNSDYKSLYPEALEMDYCSYGVKKDD